MTGDLHITRQAKTVSGKNDNGTYSAIVLSLKQGWNLVQRDRQNNTFTIKIADKDVPWTYWKD